MPIFTGCVYFHDTGYLVAIATAKKTVRLVVKFIMAFAARLSRLASQDWLVKCSRSKVILNRTTTKSRSSTRRLDHELQLAFYRAVRTLHTFSMAIPRTPAVSRDLHASRSLLYFDDPTHDFYEPGHVYEPGPILLV